MDKRKVRTKVEKGGANVIVNVKVGETKPKKTKRRRRVVKKREQETGISRIGRTGVEYLPSYVTPDVYPLRATDSKTAQSVKDLGEELKKEKTLLLEDIGKQTEQQIIKYVAKQQGAEQRSELSRAGLFDPFSNKDYAQPPLLDIATQTQPPSLTEIIRNKPIIEEIKKSRGRPLGSKDKPKIIPDPNVEGQFIEVASRRKPKLKIVQSLSSSSGIIPVDIEPQEVLEEAQSRIPKPIIEEMPLTRQRAEEYNLI